MVAYSYVQNVFPIYESLKTKSIESYSSSSKLGLGFTIIVYISVAIIGILLFGTGVQSSILLNFGEITTPTGG